MTWRRRILLCLVATAAATGSIAAPSLAASQLAVQPAALTFGDHVVSDTSTYESQIVGVKNPNGVTSVVQGSSLVGPGASSFAIVGSSCVTAVFTDTSHACHVTVSFRPAQVGLTGATLRIVDDTGTTDVPLSGRGVTAASDGSTRSSATGARLTVDPGEVAFGDAGVGADVARPIRVRNDGDETVRPQAYLLGGWRRAFSLSPDGCGDQDLEPGRTCTVIAHFTPYEAGDRDGTLMLLSDDRLLLVGLNGTGVPAPAGAAILRGAATAGSRLRCAPTGFPAGTVFRYGWTRNGRSLAARTSSTLGPGDGDVGARLSCRLHAANAVGARSVRSRRSGPVAPMDLGSQARAFVDAPSCRVVVAARRVRRGGIAATVAYGRPVTPLDPLVVRSASTLGVTLDGHPLGRGRGVAITPRALAAFADGVHTLGLRSAGHRVGVRLALAPCSLAVRMDGGPHRVAGIAISARTGIRSLAVALPRGLRIGRAPHRELGYATIKSAGFPVRVVRLLGPRTRSNGLTIVVSRHGLRFAGLPPETGVIRVFLRPELVTGHGGTARATARLRGRPGRLGARARVIWTA